MNILFVGVLDAAWSTNCEMMRALERLGNKVDTFNYRTNAERYVSVSLHKNGWIEFLIEKLSSFLRSARLPVNSLWYYQRNGRLQMNAELLENVKCNSYDLVLLAKTDTVNFALIPEINKYCKTWYYYMDPEDQAIRINAAAYAKRATWASASVSNICNYFKKRGAQAFWITQGFDKEIFNPKFAEAKYNVVFVGTRTPNRKRQIQLLRTAGINTKCFGIGWENSKVYQKELIMIYQASKIVLNFPRGSGFSNRVFQVMATGAFMLSEYCTDLEKLFKRGIHLDWFKNDQEMIEKAKYWIENDVQRELVAKQGCEYVQKEFSWDRTMEKLCAIVNNNTSTDQKGIETNG